MTSRERLLKVLNGELPDCVPVAPDTSNMIPAKLTGLPYWDIYLYQKTPIWKAYISCVKHFGFDSLMDGYVPILFDDLGEVDHDCNEVIVFRNEERIITQSYSMVNGKKQWQESVNVYYRDNPPTWGLHPHQVHLPLTPDKYWEIEEKQEWPQGEKLLKLVKEEMGDHGLVGVWCGTSVLIHNEQEIYDYYDDPGRFNAQRDVLLEKSRKRFDRLMSLSCKPDFICTGGSGSLVFQTPDMFRELALPIVKEITGLCKQNGIPSHVHSCGPEKELVKILYRETDLTVIDPLEVPPMGDCCLKELKERYGDKLVLKGNLHTTDVMLNGTAEQVIQASKQAIDDAAVGGRFILSTGDQCGRDTPEENIFAMVETARTYGRYA